MFQLNWKCGIKRLQEWFWCDTVSPRTKIPPFHCAIFSCNIFLKSQTLNRMPCILCLSFDIKMVAFFIIPTGQTLVSNNVNAFDVFPMNLFFFQLKFQFVESYLLTCFSNKSLLADRHVTKYFVKLKNELSTSSVKCSRDDLCNMNDITRNPRFWKKKG